MEYEIRRTYGHYTVYVNGEFWCTADSRREAEDEIEEIEKGEING